MDILSKLRIVFWGLVIGLWGIFMYQYINEDMSVLKRFRVGKDPLAAPASPAAVLKRNLQRPQLPDQPALQTQAQAQAQPQAAARPALPQSSLSLIRPGADIKEIPGGMMPEHSANEKTAIPVVHSGGEENYPDAPPGFAMKVMRHFVVYEEGPAVSSELEETVEALHGNIMLDLVAFSPWAREKKVFIFFSQSQETYRRITGRPAWSGGAASLSERKIYLYKSEEAFGILAHELTHIYFDSFFPASSPSPLWLSEGVATYIQSERGFSTPAWLSQNLALLQRGSGFKLGDLVRIENLQGADEDNVRLWYAQSYSVVRFLMKLKAGDAFYVFCKSLREGRPAAQSLYQAYGMPYNKLSSLEYAWRYDLKTGKISGVNR
ncbi:MAG: hypothetical protein A2X35_05750 [Elusimicrobia bacterium GWA2_61_42]|nr:MAG: hypothetical protein A2X35_05750 [Elusimicrobia bacterium GWA2_61_42]OGR74133.1 MAG: hypothetical protein A2X38_10915 [Elusimicrobia bacterium GWC2_61_25]